MLLFNIDAKTIDWELAFVLALLESDLERTSKFSIGYPWLHHPQKPVLNQQCQPLLSIRTFFQSLIKY